MVLFNHATREMTAKIVYYGPGLCGKTTNLLVIFDKLDPKSKGKMLSLATKTDRTLFFDLLPVDIGKVGNFNLKIQLYTVPGQVFYNETRKLVLKGADAVVFVADSQPSMVESTKESFTNLLENLSDNQIDVNALPIVIQYNKRDIPGVLPVEDLQTALGFEGYPYVEAAAIKGEGVMETFKLVSKITAKHLIGKLQGKPVKPDPPKKAKKGSATHAAKPVHVAEPEPELTPATNPFADSVPFAEATLPDSYDNMEEVSLEQLLEGRGRPSTIGQEAPTAVDLSSMTPDDEVEDLNEHELVSPEEVPLPFGVGGHALDVAAADPEPSSEPSRYPRAAPEPMTTPSDNEAGSRIAELEREVQHLQDELVRLREQHAALLAEFRRGLETLTDLVDR